MDTSELVCHVGIGTPSPGSAHAGAGATHAIEHVLVLERAGLRLDPTDDAGSDAEAGERTAIAAVDVEGRTVGRVSYRRVYGLRAEVTLAVDDEYWERGLPELLLVSLCARAESMQISTFLARVPASDVRLLALLREQFAARELRDGAYVQVEFATKRRCA